MAVIKNLKSRLKENIKSKLVYAAVIACMATVFFILGYLTDKGSVGEFLSSTVNCVKLMFFSLGVFVGAGCVCCTLLTLADIMSQPHEGYGSERTTDNKLGKLFYQKPFLTSFCILVVLYIPYIILSYPGIFMGDTPIMIRQIMKCAEPTAFHPLMFIYLLTAFLKAGMWVFNSWNISIFIFSLFQVLCVIAVVSYGIKLLVELGHIHWGIAAGLCLFYAFSPIVSNYMFLISKEPLYAASILLLGECIFSVAKQGWNRRTYILLAIAAFGTAFFRIEGYYLLLLVFIVLMYRKENRKQFAYYTAAILLINICINNILIPKLDIIQGSKREAMSVPLQQTARYVAYLKDEVTPEEEAAILNAFSFYSLDEMAWSYIPTLSDPIKERFAYDVTSEEAKEYYKVWLKMGLKKPQIYIAAYIENYYSFIYPSETLTYYPYSGSEESMNKTNTLTLAQTNFYHPEALSEYREAYQNVRQKLFSVFPFSVINLSATCCWALVLWICCILYKKRRGVFQMLIPPMIIMIFCFFSPVNGVYSRYQYPIMTYLPWAIFAVHEMKPHYE